MAYSQNIPQPTDRLKDSQADILANFQELYTFLNVNHEIFASPAGQGKHKFLSMPRQNPVPAAPTGTDGLLYTALGVSSNVTELFWRRNPVGSLRPLTEGSNVADGWSQLPSGLLIKWGLAQVNAGAQTVNYPTGLGQPAFGTVFGVITTLSRNIGGGNVDINLAVWVHDYQASPLSFTVYSSARTTLTPQGSIFSWIALGTRA